MNKDTRTRWAKILLIVGRVLLAAIFLIAGFAKVKPQFGMAWSAASVRTSLSMFAMQVDSYQMLPPPAVNLIAHFLPFFELFLGLWLLSGVGLRLSSVLSVLAFCGFMAAIASAYHRGLGISCGCGIGPVEQVGPGALIRDGLKFLPLALAVTFGAFWIRRKPRSRSAEVGEAAPSTQTSIS
jgi:uncharacterized membrane protein YphA (DoxX/SURF4 family)